MSSLEYVEAPTQIIIYPDTTSVSGVGAAGSDGRGFHLWLQNKGLTLNSMGTMGGPIDDHLAAMNAGPPPDQKRS